MMLILSASQPTVSATGTSARLVRHAPDLGVDALDEVVALLVQAVDVALRRRHLVGVVGACQSSTFVRARCAMREPMESM
jgi:hypothetical protein